MNTGLYMLQFPNGKQYLGITLQSFLEREATHKSAAFAGKDTAVAEAIRQFGGVFEMIPLVISDDAECLAEIEKKAIAAYGTLTPSGYNISPGGTKIRKSEKTCGQCGESFFGATTAKYCSGTCRKRATRERNTVLRVCGGCGNEFSAVIWAETAYCSLKCVAAAKNASGKGCVPITVSGVEYPSMAQAARILNVSVGCIPNRIESPRWPDWSF